MKILLIEPDKLLSGVYRQALEKAGHEVLVGLGAQDAVLMADSVTPDLVLLEVQLPGHSGIEFLYEFRSYSEWQDIPVILHTLVPQPELELPSHLGVVAHLYKPATNLRRLTAAVNELAPVYL